MLKTPKMNGLVFCQSSLGVICVPYYVINSNIINIFVMIC
jgi:hypothetical protein